MRSKSYLFLLVVIVLGVISGIGYQKLPIRKGLDISGGVRFTYQMQKPADPVKAKAFTLERMKDLQTRLVAIMGTRASGPLGVTEPVITAKGDDEINIELPGFSDVDKALETMGTSARIEFYWANNVATDKDQNRPYLPSDSKSEGVIAVEFRKRFGDSKAIKYGDPEYSTIIKSWGEPILAGEELVDAEPYNSPSGFIPLLKFSPEGAEKMKKWSSTHFNQGEYLAAVLDGKVLSIARVNDNTVLSDNAQITGTFPDGYVANLTSTLKSGSLPVELKLLSSEKVDPTIGGDAFHKMIVAGIVSFGVISVFLIAYYAFPGVVAFIALMLYVLFTLTMLKVINATFSLAGIAGFILSVGMAVDANILVFERFKEEVKSGKSLASAIELGFKRALPAIVDSNACTIITSLVLANFGTGPVKGFATTLIIGVLISLFTAVVVTRSLLMFFVASGIATNPKWYALDRNWFGKKLEENANTQPLQIVNNSKKWFAISIISMVVSIPFFFPPLKGFKLNVEFQGGYEAVYSMGTSTLSSADITASLEKNGLKGGNVKLADSKGQRIAYVTLPPLPELKGKTDTESTALIAKAAGLNASDSRGFTQIGPAVQAETQRNALYGVLGSSALIVIYLAFRFGIGVGGFKAGLRFGMSAVGALLHDVLVVFGSAAIVGWLRGWEVSALFLTAMLTIIGFSVHDTIVIFDRIRENLHKPNKGEDFGNLVNRSITQSFARSINTSATVIVTLALLAFFGTATPDLTFFVVAMLIGIMSGTYSSIYNASPILYLWDRKIGEKKGEAFTLVGMARAELDRSRIIGTHAAEPETVVGPSGRSYGQVRRRANDPKKGIKLDD